MLSEAVFLMSPVVMHRQIWSEEKNRGPLGVCRDSFKKSPGPEMDPRVRMKERSFGGKT